jgi:DNA-binding GntR family transcriptional regulator
MPRNRTPKAPRRLSAVNRAKPKPSRGAAKAPPLPLGEAAYRHLKEMILTCELRPGEAVSEPKLSVRLGVTKASVRMALARLGQEGLLRAVPRLGHVVAALTMQDVQDIYAIRLMLEPRAARLAAARISNAELDRLEELADVAYSAGDRVSENRFLISNRAFHVALAHASGNERLARVIEKLHDDVARILAICTARRTVDWQHGHQKILNALRKHDGAAAETIQRSELEKSSRLVTGSLLQGSQLMTMNLGSQAPETSLLPEGTRRSLRLGSRTA